MNTIPQWLEFCRVHGAQYDDLRDKINLYTLALIHVYQRVSDAHVVKTYDKASKRWRVGIMSVELGLDKRRLITVGKLVAPVLIGREYVYDEKRNPNFVFAMDAFISAQEHLQALEVIKGVA
jgi:hypothetical protein